MSVTFAEWSPKGRPGVIRIYLNGHALRSGTKVWIEPGEGGGYKAICNNRARFGEAHRVVAEAIQHLVESGDLPTSPSWADVLGYARDSNVPSRSPTSRWRALKSSRPAQYGSEHTVMLDANSMSHPMPSPTVVQVDHREPADLIDGLRAIDNLVVETASLEIGDFVVPGPDGDPILIIERKTVADLVTSITEDAKRLFKQTNALKANGATAVVLIEGDLYGNTRLPLTNMAGTLSYLAVEQRVSIVPTLDMNHSVYQIAKLVRHAAHGLGYTLSLRGSGPKDRKAAAKYVLEGIPGVSAKKAGALLAHFGSVRAVALADEDALRDVDGIGPATAQMIVQTLSG